MPRNGWVVKNSQQKEAELQQQQQLKGDLAEYHMINQKKLEHSL